jgi:LmbE family N-acetylglucosaminyl deacetylase
MIPLAFPSRPLTLLCIGAHADDIEIGCGGSVLHLLDRHPGSTVWWVVLTAEGTRSLEASESASLLLASAGTHRIRVHGFRDGHLPGAWVGLKEVFEELKRDVIPDLIFTHFRDDRHQDHRLVSDLTWQTFRNHVLLEYEIPKYDGDLGSPNGFIPISRELRARKIEHLLAAFPSQREKQWFTEETFLGLLRIRGMECAAPDGYAEAFYLRKAVLEP